MDYKRIISKINMKDLTDAIKLIISYIPGKIIRIIKKNEIWIVTERMNEAKDNAYWFFKYACKHSDNDIYYAINIKCKDYSKVENYGKIIQFGSIRHYIYTIASDKYISSQYSNGFPGRIVYYAWIYGIVNLNFYFLQHGVTQNKSWYLEEPSKRVKLFCCVSEREAKFAEELGYKKKASRILGFCRYDGLVNNSSKNIFIMFTWRKYLTGISEKDFLKSTFYKHVDLLINDEHIHDCLKNYHVNFFLHPGMAAYQHLFKSKYKNVRFIKEENIDFQKMISKSKLFITDYSSVAFDFAYLSKPVIYYQFDDREFREGHLQEGYYNYSNDGFGPICNDICDVVKALNTLTDSNIYQKRARAFYKYHDFDNCKRVFDFVKK